MDKVTHGCNNIANKLEIVQNISLDIFSRGSSKKITHQVSSTINSSWEIIYSGIGNLLNKCGVLGNGKKNGKFLLIMR